LSELNRMTASLGDEPRCAASAAPWFVRWFRSYITRHSKIWLTSLSMINSGTPVLLAILTAPLIISESQVEVFPGFESIEAACAGSVALTPSIVYLVLTPGSATTYFWLVQLLDRSKHDEQGRA
jgi:hypothetical protein